MTFEPDRQMQPLRAGRIIHRRQTILRASLAVLALTAWTSVAPLAHSEPVAGLHDGQHDFDFALGTWTTHIHRLDHPLSGSNVWTEALGTVTSREVWGGRAHLEEVEADSAKGHLESLCLFLYDPTAHQWSLTFAGGKAGAPSLPPSVGEFQNGRGDFYDQETYQGRAILARVSWFAITPNSHRFEQAFSDDGGKTWEINMTAELTRKSSS